MNPEHARRPPLTALVGVALVSAAAIAMQIALTRIYAITLWHHFAYLVVGLALLGFGVAGAWLAARGGAVLPDDGEPAQVLSRRARHAAVASLVALSLAMVLRPNALMLLRDVGVAFSLAAMVAFSTVPFVGAGAVIGTALAVWPARAGRVYAADLVGGGLGALAVAFAIGSLGALGIVGACVVAFAVAALLFSFTSSSWGAGWRASLVTLLGLVLVLVLAFDDEDAWILPAPTKELSLVHRPQLGVRAVEHRAWTPHGRVDVLGEIVGPPLVAGEVGHFEARWPVRILTQDGAAPTTMHGVKEHPRELTFLSRSTTAVAWVVRGVPFGTPESDDGARVLVIGVGGGIDVMLARAYGAAAVDGVEINPAILELTTSRYADFVGRFADSPRVSLHEAEGRAFLGGTTERYDLIQLAGVDTFTALASGAYSLAEDYVYTVEAFEDYLAHLQQGGCLSVSRLILDPPRETLRLAHTAARAMERGGETEPWRRVAVVRGRLWSTLLACREPLDTESLERLRAWVKDNGFALAHDPGGPQDGPFASVLHPGAERDAFIADYAYALEPARDEAPFFFDYFRWRSLGKLRALTPESMYATGVPIGHGMQLLTLLLTVGLAVLGILRPLRRLRSTVSLTPAERRTIGVYFAALGAGFLLVEVALIQRLTFLLGHPTHALTVVLAGLLLASGVGAAGSRLLERSWVRRGAPVVVVAGLLAVAAFSFFGLPMVVGRSFGVRLGAALSMVGLLGLGLGTLFPHGVRVLADLAPPVVPWAFGVNAFLTVVAASVAPLLAAETGFSALFVVAAAMYALAFVALTRLESAHNPSS